MLRLLRFLLTLVLLGAFVWFASSVKLGRHTLFGHVARIWKAEETQDLVEGTRETAKPAIDRLKRGVEKGVEAAREDAPDAAPARKKQGK